MGILGVLTGTLWPPALVAASLGQGITFPSCRTVQGGLHVCTNHAALVRVRKGCAQKPRLRGPEAALWSVCR